MVCRQNALNEQVRRKVGRFPTDFVFQLNAKEAWDEQPLRSQIATSKEQRGGRRTLPWAYTKHGTLMAATVLNSKRAAEMSVYVIRAFVKMRSELARHQNFAWRLAEIERTLTGHDEARRELFVKIRGLLLPGHARQRRRIGFLPKEPAARNGECPADRVAWPSCDSQPAAQR